MNKFQHTAQHSAINSRGSAVFSVLKDLDTSPVVKIQLKCLYMLSHNPDNHSMKAVQLIYVMIE